MPDAAPSATRGHIGIVAISAEGAALCYTKIARAIADLPPGPKPAVTLHNIPFDEYLDALSRGDWARVAVLLLESADTLAAAGAGFCILPDNVAHHALALADHAAPLPFLNMVELVADEARRRELTTLGLIGTRFVTEGSTYQTFLGVRGIKLLVPDPDGIELIDRVIFREAVFGHVSEPSKRRVQHALGDLAGRGCQSLVFGCSEAALLVDPLDAPVPVIDPLELLAAAAVLRAAQHADAA